MKLFKDDASKQHLLESFKTTAKFASIALGSVFGMMLFIILAIVTSGATIILGIFCLVWAIVHHEQKQERQRKERYKYF